MKRFFLPLSLFLTLTFSLSVALLKPKYELARDVEYSIVKLQHSVIDEDGVEQKDQTYTCTGFVIDAAKGWILTAKHCVINEDQSEVEHITIDGVIEGEVIKTSESLALIKIKPMYKAPLRLREEKLHPTDEVIAIGYGFGDLTRLVRHISDPSMKFGKGEDIILDGPLAPGMSGGPIVDLDGRVVGISQQNSPFMIISRACNQNEMRDFLKNVK